jgi:hypothetical protein
MVPMLFFHVQVQCGLSSSAQITFQDREQILILCFWEGSDVSLMDGICVLQGLSGQTGTQVAQNVFLLNIKEI